jgi:hypothetical protein
MNRYLMRLIIGIVICLMILAPVATAAGPGGSGSGQGSQDGQGQQQTQVQQQQLRSCDPGQACNGTHLRQMIMEQEQLINASVQQQNRERNMIQLAVHAITISENLVGEQGPQMLQIANQVNNSHQLTLRAEERIQNQNTFMRFFVGGDAESADEILQEVEQNRNRIQEMNQIINECECDKAVGDLLREQVQNMEQEQNRLQQLAQNEKADTGLFGRFFR